MIRAFVFDLDGTLVGAAEMLSQSNNERRVREGVEEGPET
jgi:phosphoglycolate phosphatase-like HAD superfamily hydrolase